MRKMFRGSRTFLTPCILCNTVSWNVKWWYFSCIVHFFVIPYSPTDYWVLTWTMILIYQMGGKKAFVLLLLASKSLLFFVACFACRNIRTFQSHLGILYFKLSKTEIMLLFRVRYLVQVWWWYHTSLLERAKTLISLEPGNFFLSYKTPTYMVPAQLVPVGT